MGAKFCNLNVKGSVGQISMGIEAETYECAPGWTTVTSPYFQWGNTQKYAERLSAELNAPVLCTEYFDDDYAEFTVYEGGKRAARHVPATYEEFRRVKGNPGKFLSALGMDQMDAPVLEKIFSEKDPEQAVYLVESFFGCPIFGVKDSRPPDEAPDPNVVKNYLGATTQVRYAAVKRKADKKSPPYFGGELGEPPCQIGEKYHEDTVFCWGADKSRIIKDCLSAIKVLEKEIEEAEKSVQRAQLYVKEKMLDDDSEIQWAKNYAEYVTETNQRIIDSIHYRLFLFDDMIVVKGIQICNVDADLPEISGQYRCLTAATRICSERSEDKTELYLYTGFAYGKKLLCYGKRGDYPKVIEDLTLESPWLNLGPDELVSAFETPAFWDAVRAMGDLLGAPIWGEEPGQGWKLSEEMPHIKVYVK